MIVIHAWLSLFCRPDHRHNTLRCFSSAKVYNLYFYSPSLDHRLWSLSKLPVSHPCPAETARRRPAPQPRRAIDVVAVCPDPLKKWAHPTWPQVCWSRCATPPPPGTTSTRPQTVPKGENKTILPSDHSRIPLMLALHGYSARVYARVSECVFSWFFMLWNMERPGNPPQWHPPHPPRRLVMLQV